MRRHLFLLCSLSAIACSDADIGSLAGGSDAGHEGAVAGGGAGGSSTGTGGGSADGGSAQGGSSDAGGGGAASSVCPSQAMTPGDHAGSIQHDGLTRSYQLRVPASYDNTAPIALVFDLHGLGSNVTQQRLLSGWQALAEAEGVAVVWPQGSGAIPSWNGGDTCCGEALAQGRDDVGLMKAILEQVRLQLCIDDRRVYASGLSNGGAMAHRIACDAADVFAAVAPVSYPIAYLPLSKCTPSRPIAVMHFHGTQDTVVPYEGTFGVASAQASFAQWATIDGCSGGSVETFSQGSSRCDTHETCQGGVEVSLCTITGPHVLYGNADSVPIASLAWAFFSKHPLP